MDCLLPDLKTNVKSTAEKKALEPAAGSQGRFEKEFTRVFAETVATKSEDSMPRHPDPFV